MFIARTVCFAVCIHCTFINVYFAIVDLLCLKKTEFVIFIFSPQVNKGSDIDKVFGHQTQVLRLVDFGQAIDMSLYPPGTTFLAKVKTSGFQCIEMMTDRPWTFQVCQCKMLCMTCLSQRNFHQIHQTYNHVTSI